jgi:predicted nucleic acid-binding protein
VKLLLDVNIILDVALQRTPWNADGVRLFAEIETGRAAGYVAGHTVTTAHYVVARALGKQTAALVVSDLLRMFEVVPVEKADFHQAVALGMRDFEDAVQAACALKVGADYIATRNEKDFQGIPIPARSAGSILALL